MGDASATRLPPPRGVRRTPVSTGVWYGIAANVVWGLSPIYWKQLDHVPAPVLIGHRVLWSFLTLGVLLFLIRHRYRFKLRRPNRRVASVCILAAVLICAKFRNTDIYSHFLLDIH